MNKLRSKTRTSLGRNKTQKQTMKKEEKTMQHEKKKEREPD
jgi:hypothetical protein